ncbi:4a-hydroxytetrahydrobiopterin dehydratase [Candidatus Woesearchaeota archaeon]|nr:4a-hydroxytetrahydrobiopterin dehydratase [Candidatus Woesearchaeota archaeon]
MDLQKKKCKPCEGGVPALSDLQAQRFLKMLKGWKLVSGRIERDYTFKDFVDASSWLERVKFLAEAEEHHPDIHWTWNKITLVLWTHAIHGLSENDFILAAKIDALGK